MLTQKRIVPACLAGLVVAVVATLGIATSPQAPASGAHRPVNGAAVEVDATLGNPSGSASQGDEGF